MNHHLTTGLVSLFTGISPFFMLAIFALATWRLTTMLHQETGPWDIFVRFRHWAGVVYDDYGLPLIGEPGASVLAEVLSCKRCLSVWIAIGMVVVAVVLPPIAWLFALPFALSAMSILMDMYFDA